MSSVAQKKSATIDDLYRAEGKAELIDGKIVHFMPTGYRPNQIAGEIFVSLKIYSRAVGRGTVYTDNIGFVVPKLPSGRESFSPGASYYDGPLPSNEMDFVAGSPTLAVEVRSKGDYGHAAEVKMTSKRADYFLAGTLVVWDVDPQARCVRSYRADAPDQSVTFHEGELAEAEPAVPGWRIAVMDFLA